MMRQTRVPRKATKCAKLRGVQRSPELALRTTDFRAPENLILPVLFRLMPLSAATFILVEIFLK